MPRDFEVGDLVRVRQWIDMEAEFGTNRSGDIPCHLCFVKRMRDLCGREAEITGITGWDSNEYLFENDEELNRWRISGDMLEYPDDGDDFSPLTDAFGGLL